MKTNQNDFERSPHAATDFDERVRLNQQKLTAELKLHYDFILRMGLSCRASRPVTQWRRASSSASAPRRS
jgi:hypothetical protein